MNEQRNWFPEMAPTGEETMKTVEMTTEDIEYDITWLIKQWQGVRGWTLVLEEVLL